MTDAQPRQRLDKWLWQARFCKTRALAARLIGDGHVRVNGLRTDKPARAVGEGDVLTFPQGHVIRVVRILALATRRGPAPEAQTLYQDMTPEGEDVPETPGHDGTGRPTKRDRRTLDLSRRQMLE
ncbi:MAG: RNA-binding S4 domain-containing protein [Rhodobacteraceae bacterium]|nr:MAG: RNA-binding S4 domain-containing protein [Paracoccaceae bacterium]